MNYINTAKAIRDGIVSCLRQGQSEVGPESKIDGDDVLGAICSLAAAAADVVAGQTEAKQFLSQTPFSVLTPGMHLQLGTALLAAGRQADAIVPFDDVLGRLENSLLHRDRRAAAEFRLAVACALMRRVPVASLRGVLAEIDPADLEKAEGRYQLATLLTRVGLFEKAISIFSALEASGKAIGLHWFEKAIAHYCLWHLAEARGCLEHDIEARGPLPLTLFWAARVCFLLGHFDEARRIVEAALRASVEDGRIRSFLLMEQGNISRSLGEFDQAVAFYEQALACQGLASQPTVWMSMFEYACLLEFLGRREEARRVARFGAEITVENENACVVLAEYLAWRDNKCAAADPDRWSPCHERSFQPFLPYAAWSVLILATVHDHEGRRGHAAELVRTLVLDSAAFEPSARAELSAMLDARGSWRRGAVFAALGRAFRPFHPEGGFDRELFGRLLGKTGAERSGMINVMDSI